MNLYLQLISIMLTYPDEEMMRSLDDVQSLIPEIQDQGGRAVLREFVRYLRGTPIVRLQEEYTRRFDLNPATSMDLTLHRGIHEAERGRALSSLAGIYRDEGLEKITGELPDHLPLLLEFLAVGSEGACEAIRRDFREPTKTLAANLEEEGSPYAALVGLAAKLMTETRGPESRVQRSGVQKIGDWGPS